MMKIKKSMVKKEWEPAVTLLGRKQLLIVMLQINELETITTMLFQKEKVSSTITVIRGLAQKCGNEIITYQLKLIRLKFLKYILNSTQIPIFSNFLSFIMSCTPRLSLASLVDSVPYGVLFSRPTEPIYGVCYA